jgi:D-beta-D-heptose 7-phosphate kinase/D-beta-D-heptose 1-phosphate adenosyltransferase
MQEEIAATQVLPGIDRLLALLPQLANAHAVVVGDVMLDRYVYGSVERISPEAPIPVLAIEREMAMPGGAGNVARNLAALGAQTIFGAAIGRDGAGIELERLFADDRSIQVHLAVDATRRTTVKTRFVGATQQLLRTDSEQRAPMTDTTRRNLLERLGDLQSGYDIMILSDYGKGVLEGGFAGTLIALARKAGRKVVIDPKGRDYTPYRGADILTPNGPELADATGMPAREDADVVAAARKLIADHDLGALVATRGARGMTLVQRDGAVFHMPARAVEVFDVSGAGDTVISVLAAALAVGAQPIEAAMLANAAAGVVVSKLGTATCTLEELSGALQGQRRAPHAENVFELDHLRDQVAGWRRSGLKVGFTNGCFDLLHAGHISLIRQARAACDRLIVGLNTDASVKRLKGEGRPVNGENARAVVLASLADVDAVTLFGDDTPLALIRELKPDVLVKGADYTEATVVGADIVKGYGGKVVLADLTPGFSTTGTIARMGGKSAKKV